MLRQRAIFIAVIQSVLFVAHAFVYGTWIAFARTAGLTGGPRLGIIFALLSCSFVAATLLAFRYYTAWVRVFYVLAATWLGILNYLFFSAIGCWIAYAAAVAFGIGWKQQEIAIVLFGFAFVVAVYATMNASRTRVKRVRLKLTNLPDLWRGRVAALVSDMHLGPVRGTRFTQRIVSMLNHEKPDIVFLTGDVYDGTAADVNSFAKPFRNINATFGTYFVTGNHEEFGDETVYLDGLRQAGVNVLENRSVTLDGLQIVGVFYRELTTPARFRAVMQRAGLDKQRASILLAHAPNRLWEAEEAGISLQLSGHTHRGQFLPWTQIVSRIYGKFAYGLQMLGNMAVYTTSGAGTWGPPLRLGTNSEIVFFEFE